MIDLAILGLLAEHDLHGYELQRRLAELPGTRAQVSFGSLYPALARLEKAGAVAVIRPHRDAAHPVPMTGSLGGEVAAFRAGPTPRALASVRGRRNKKVYGLTATGRSRLTGLLVEPATDDRTFVLQVAFCAQVPSEARLALFQRRRAQLAAVLAERSAGPDHLGDRYRRALADRDLSTTGHDIAWLDQLITDEQRPSDEQRPPIDQPHPQGAHP